MRLLSLAVLVLVLGLAGCTHERPLSELHELAGKQVTIETPAGGHFSAIAEEAPGGMTYLAETGYVGAENVGRVVAVRRGQGALEGLGIGALVGASGGAIAGFVDGDDECSPEGWCFLALSAGEKATVLGVLFGVLGGGVGAIVGAAYGSHYVYSYQQPRITPSGPPGSVAGVTVTF